MRTLNSPFVKYLSGVFSCAMIIPLIDYVSVFLSYSTTTDVK